MGRPHRPLARALGRLTGGDEQSSESDGAQFWHGFVRVEGKASKLVGDGMGLLGLLHFQAELVDEDC